MCLILGSPRKPRLSQATLKKRHGVRFQQVVRMAAGGRTMPALIDFKQQQTQAEFDHPRTDRLIKGNPKRTTWNHFTNSTAEVFSGVWSSEVGSWRIEFGPTEDEFFFVVAGRVKVIGDDGQTADIRAGESLVIPAGFKGTFEVIEPVTKHYMIVDRKTST
jgi:uncharacterized cupin superfamily protein